MYTPQLLYLFICVAAAAAKSLQSCLTLCNSIYGSLPGSPVPGILQARTLEWVAIPSPMHESESEVTQSCPNLATPWTAAYQAPPSMGVSRQEYWSGLPFPSPLCYVLVIVNNAAMNIEGKVLIAL